MCLFCNCTYAAISSRKTTLANYFRNSNKDGIDTIVHHPVFLLLFPNPRTVMSENVGGIMIQLNLSCHFNGVLIDRLRLRIELPFSCIYYNSSAPVSPMFYQTVIIMPRKYLLHLILNTWFIGIVYQILAGCVKNHVGNYSRVVAKDACHTGN